MDAIIAKQPEAIMLDVIKQHSQQTLLDLYNLDIEPQQDRHPKLVKLVAVSSDEQAQDMAVLLPHHYLPVYEGAELQNFIPEGLELNQIASLPLASYSVDATARSVLEFYQSFYPDYEYIKHGNFVVLVQDKQPFEGYSPEYMAIPHIVISEDPLGKGKTLLQIIYRPDTAEIKGTRAMIFKPVT